MQEIVGAMSVDKKRTGSGIKLVMVKKIGESFVMPVTNEELKNIFGV